MGLDQHYNNEDVLGFVDEFNTHYPTSSGSQGGGSQVFTDYEIPYTPSLILIAPDRSIVEQAIARPVVAQDLIDLLETYNLSVSGLDDISQTSVDFSFFPNPVENTIHIRPVEGEKIKQIKIFQLTGQEIFSKQSSGFSIDKSYDVSFLQGGIYLLSLEFESGHRLTKTFIKR